MTKQKHKSKLYLFSLGLLPMLMMINISGQNLLKNVLETSETKYFISKTGWLADGYFEYQDEKIGVEFGDKNNGDDQVVKFLAAPTTDVSENKSQPKSIAWKITNPDEAKPSWWKNIAQNIENTLGGRFTASNWKITNDQAVLSEVLPDVDLRYKILPNNGLKEELIVKGTKEVADNYHFDLTTDSGIKLQKADETNSFGLDPNTYYFTDANNNYIAHFLPITVYDSNGQTSDQAKLEIWPVKNNLYQINISVDYNWLHSVDRQYPIFIDPTIVHDTLEDFNAGTAMNRVEALSGPKVQLNNQELSADISTIGLWHINETSGSTVKDFSGNNYDGSATGTTIVDGKFGKARSFNGSSDLIDLGKNPSVKNSSQVTIEAWVYPTSLSTYFPIYFESNNTTGYTRLMLNIGTDGSLGLSGRDTDGTSSIRTFASSSIGLISTNKWYHVAGVYNADTDIHKVYINGTDVTTTGNVAAVTFPNTTPADNIFIGYAIGGNYANGVIDEISLTRRALTKEQIKADAQFRSSGVYTSEVIDLNTVNPEFNSLNWTENGVRTGDGETDLTNNSLVAQWNFNETNGITATNNAGSCGATCNGTLTNMTTTAQDAAINSGWTANNKKWGAGSLMFDGADDYVNIGKSSSVKNQSKVSVSAWVKINNTSNYQTIYYESNNNVGYSRLLFTIETDRSVRLGGRYNDDTSSFIAFAQTSANAIEIGKWYYLVGIFDADTDQHKIYINAQDQTVTRNNANIFPNTDPVENIRIGATNSAYSNAILDKVSLYFRTLSTDEILSNYQAGNVQFQTRTGTDDTPEDGNWEEWRPSGSNPSGTETQILNMDSDQTNWTIDSANNTPITKSDESNIKQEGSGSLKTQIGISQVDANTVGLWNLDETGGSGAYIKDVSGNNNHGTPTGTTVVDGINNKARYFNGSSNYVGISNPSTGIKSGGAKTISAWIKTGSTRGVIFNSYDGTYGYQIYVDTSGNITLYSNGGGTLVTTSKVNDNIWHHVAAVWDGTTAYVYLDGVQKISGTRTITTNNTAEAQIGVQCNGSCPNGADYYFTGIIDEVKVDNIARTANEIAEAYRMGRDHRMNRTISSTDLSNKSLLPFYIAADQPGTYLETTIGESAYANNLPDANTVGLWHLEEANGSGAYLKDNSSYGNNGTPTGTTLIDGKIGKARSFNGSSDYINLGNNSSLSSDTQTISFWLMNKGTNKTAYIIDRSPNSDIWGLFGIVYNSSQLYITANGEHQAVIPYSSLSNGDFLTFTFNYPTVDFYLNGKLYNTLTFSNHFNVGSSNATSIGRAGEYNNYFFDGTIDEVRIDNAVRTPDEIRQAYEINLRTHAVTIDFAASLDSGNLITDSGDTSFTIDATKKGLSQKGDKLFVGDKIIIRENYDGTEYIAQGSVDSINISTGAVTVGSWDSGETFPSGGFTVNADVFKWQQEYFDLTSSQTIQRDAITNIATRVTDGVEGRTIWLDDFKSVGSYLTDPNSSTINSSPHQYFQYRFIPTTTDKLVTPSVSNVALDYEMSIMTIAGGSTDQTYLNNNNKNSFNISINGITCDEVDATITAQASWNQSDWYDLDQTISPVTNIALTSNPDVTSWNGYPADGSSTPLYIRAKTVTTTSNVESITIEKDTINPIVTGVTNVDVDNTFPYNDSSDDGVTDVIYTSSSDSVFCRWSETDQSYAAMPNTCDSTTNCTLNLTGIGEKNIYMRCKDAAGNENNDILSPSPTLTYEIGGISINSASTSKPYINNHNKNSFNISANNVIFETLSSNVTTQGSWNQTDWYDITTVASPVNDASVTGNGDLTLWADYPADGTVTIYVRAKSGVDDYSNIKSFSVVKDTIDAGVTGISSVAADAELPFVDPTNNQNTMVIYTASTDAATCKWDTTASLDYADMNHTCESLTNCAINLEGRGNHTVYFRCLDNHDNRQSGYYSLSYSISSSSYTPNGWQQQRKINIDPATPIDNYQVRVELTPATFDYDNAKDDGSDIQFFDNNDNQYNYWIEKWDKHGSSIVWVKIPQAGISQFNLYYGNYSGTNESSFNNVFGKNYNSSGLVGWWHFDDDLTSAATIDSSGNNNLGNLTNGPLWQDTDGGAWADQSDTHFSTGHHLSFDGINDYINVPHSSSIDPQTAWTLETWVNRNYMGTQHSLIEKFPWVAGQGGYAMRIEPNNKLTGYIINGTSAQACVGATSILDGQWYHLAVTYDSTTDSLKCYVNGVLDGLNTGVTYNPLSSSSSVLKLGARGNDNSTVLDGYMDEVRIYNRALNLGEIRSDYERRNYHTNGVQTRLGGSQLTGEQYTGQSDWLDPAWQYRSELTVFNNDNSNSLTNYQVVFNLDSQKLVNASQMQIDGSDLRFTNSDGVSLLSHFAMENINEINTKLFIKIPEIGADSQKKIFLYYGNPTATNVSTDATLEFYDDFNDGTISSSKWPTQNLGTYITEENGEFKMTGVRASNYYLKSPALSSDNLGLVVEAKTSSPSLPVNGWSPVSWWQSTSVGQSILDHPSSSLSNRQYSWSNGVTVNIGENKPLTENHINQIILTDNFHSTIQTQFASSYWANWSANYYNNAQGDFHLRLGALPDNYDPGSIQTMDGRIDWVLARKYSEYEPRVGTYKVAYTSKKGDIDSETWSGTIYVEEPVTINPGATLTIEPGTIVKFNTDTYLLANNANITAIGLSYDPIVFTSVNDNNLGTIMDNSTGAPIAGDWKGIYVIGNDSTGYFKFCDFDYGGDENIIDTTTFKGMLNAKQNNPTILNTVFNNSANADIFAFASSPLVYRNNLGDSPYGIYLDANNQIIPNSIEYNSFANTTNAAVFVDNLPNTDNNTGPGLVLRNNDIDETNTGFYIQNKSGDTIGDSNAENTVDARQNSFKNLSGYMGYFDVTGADSKFDRTNGGEILFDTNSVILEAPNGNEHWMAGSIQTVSWNFNNGSSNGNYVDIYLSPNSGEEFDFTVAANLRCDGSGSGPGCSGNTGSYSWLVSGVPNNEKRLKIVLRDSSGQSLVEDMSDRNFQINLITDELSKADTGSLAKHTIKFAIPFDWPDLVNDSFKISLPNEFNFSLGSSDITATGGDVIWGSGVVNAINNTITIPFTGTLDDSDGLLTFILGNGSNLITNPTQTGSYRITITTHDNATGTNPALHRLSTNININDDIAFSFNIPAALQLAIRDITDSNDINRLRFENPTANNILDVSHLIKVATNAHNGYSVTISEDHDLTGPSGTAISDFIGTNESPAAWTTPPGGAINGYYGYHTDDNSLSYGVTNRFANANTWAAVTADPKEISYFPSSTQNETTTMTYRLQFTPKQVAGHYEQTVLYTITPNY